MSDKQQADLFAPVPLSTDADARALETLLHQRRGWLTAARILELANKPVTDDNKRWIRDVARRGRYVLSGPGSPGYKHIARATAEEIRHFKNANISQGKDMIRRGLQIGRSAHEIFG